MLHSDCALQSECGVSDSDAPDSLQRGAHCSYTRSRPPIALTPLATLVGGASVNPSGWHKDAKRIVQIRRKLWPRIKNTETDTQIQRQAASLRAGLTLNTRPIVVGNTGDNSISSYRLHAQQLSYVMAVVDATPICHLYGVARWQPSTNDGRLATHPSSTTV